MEEIKCLRQWQMARYVIFYASCAVCVRALAQNLGISNSRIPALKGLAGCRFNGEKEATSCTIK